MAENIDRPASINQFLRSVNKTLGLDMTLVPDSDRVLSSKTSESTSSPEQAFSPPAGISNHTSGLTTPAIGSNVGSPAYSSRAPPSTPASVFGTSPTNDFDLNRLSVVLEQDERSINTDSNDSPSTVTAGAVADCHSPRQEERPSVISTENDARHNSSSIADGNKLPRITRDGIAEWVQYKDNRNAEQIRSENNQKHDTSLEIGSGKCEGQCNNSELPNSDIRSSPKLQQDSFNGVRTVILRNLPLHADYKLVQSLVHGDVVERFVMNPSGTIAFVTFISVDACDQYHVQYPNGLEFQLGSSKHIVLVDKKREPDMMSYSLRGQLQCGATRVLVIEGINSKDKVDLLVEMTTVQADQLKTSIISINLDCADVVRKATIQFTNIIDAIKFRGQVLDDPNFGDCSLSYANDPCVTSSGVHLKKYDSRLNRWTP